VVDLFEKFIYQTFQVENVNSDKGVRGNMYHESNISFSCA